MTRHVVVAGAGDPCPRCGQPTEIREHACISNRELRRPYYYRRWFMCRNSDCRTTTIVPARFQVFNGPSLVPSQSPPMVVTTNSTEAPPW
jgi:hypothetical protein